MGVRTLAIPHLQSTLSFWYLHSNSELQQDGDTGATVPSASPSNRYGIEWANYYTPRQNLVFDLDFADSWARFTEVDPDDAAYTNPGGGQYPVQGPGGKWVPKQLGWCSPQESLYRTTKVFGEVCACAPLARAI